MVYARFAHEGPLVAVEFSPDGRWLVSASEDRSMKLWQVDGLLETHLFPAQNDVVTGLAFAPNSTRLVVTRMDGSWEVVKVPQSGAAVKTTETEVVAHVPMIQEPALEELEEQEPNDALADTSPISLPV